MKYRVFWNRGDAENWPQCWSFDEGDQSTEACVQGIDLNGCHAITRELPPPARETADPKRIPTGWIEVEAARCEVRGGRAIFRP